MVELLVHRHLKSVIITAAPSAVVESRRDVWEGIARARISRPWSKSRIVNSAEDKPPTARAHIVDSYECALAKLLLDTKIPLHRIGLLFVRIYEQFTPWKGVGGGSVP